MRIENKPRFAQGVLMLLFAVALVAIAFATRRWRFYTFALIGLSLLRAGYCLVMSLHVEGEDDGEVA